MQKFRILSIDGGGLRGIVPIRILQAIESKTGKKIHQLFDMMAGTSTGGLIVSCLTLKNPATGEPLYTLEQLSKMYTEEGGTIFPIRSKIGHIIEQAHNLLRPEFSADGMDKVLKMYISNQKIKDSFLPILVTTYDLSTNRPVFFRTRDAAENEAANANIYDICRATSAAPTYLPAYSFTYKGQTLTGIDGGVYVNNPTMAAFSEISRFGDSDFYKSVHGSEISLSDVYVLSLGTGSYFGSITEVDSVEWGQLQWVTHISDIMMKGVSQCVDFEANEMVSDGQYLRLNIDIKEEKYSDMTDASIATRDYLLNEVEQQLLNDAEIMKSLDSFLKSMQ